ncbi:ArnT family glycosyltransferase [Candidatus Auribacterota bacterium]
MKKKIVLFISKYSRYLLLLIALGYLLIYLFIALLRISYPFELEWMEGGSLEQVQRILSGKNLYVAPSLRFIPFIYTPFYFYLSSLFAYLLGINFFSLRLLSFLASLASFYLIYLFVKKETNNRFFGFVALGFFLATFRISGAWFDLARVDSLFLSLLLLTFYFIRFSDSTASYILAGFSLFLSFFTKQIALLIFLPMIIYTFWYNRYRFYCLWGTILLLIGCSTIVFNHFSDGWYNYYVYSLPAQHVWVSNLWAKFWTEDLLFKFSIPTLMALFYLLGQVISLDKKKSFFYFFMAAGMLGGSWISRLHSGGYYNVLFPAYALISILSGLFLAKTFQIINQRQMAKISLYLLCIIQFILLRYPVKNEIPTKKDRLAGENLVAEISQLKGDLWIFHHNYLTQAAKNTSHAHRMAISDVLKGNDGRIKETLLNEWKNIIQEKKYSTIIIDLYEDWPFKTELEYYYKRKRVIFADTKVFWTKTGWSTRPQWIYERK